MKKIILGCLFTAGFCTAAYCGQISEIKLSDGTVMRGEIVSMDEHICVVRTESLGEMQVDASKIKNIRMAAPQADSRAGAEDFPASPDPEQPGAELTARESDGDVDINTRIQQMQSKMMSNPKATQMITELAANPRFQELINDPAIAKAAQSGDIATLLANPKFMEMTRDPKMQEISAEVAGE